MPIEKNKRDNYDYINIEIHEESLMSKIRQACRTMKGILSIKRRKAVEPNEFDIT